MYSYTTFKEHIWMFGKMIATDHLVYLGLGGNIGNRLTVLREAIQAIKTLPGIKELKTSSFYETAPLSNLAQADYLNVACCFKTSMSAHPLLYLLQAIEKDLGKVPKPKNAPRIIDIDILFFGNEHHCTKELDIPHPKWQERLFVVAPLSDLITKMTVPLKNKKTKTFDILKLKQSLINEGSQRVSRFIE